ncbi:GNAT family N-acetyltransferase [Streptomyces kaniharaensis]|uniref:GNAT family N-acetyltransferase n=1 Tax=Streptomyces kaniharaensis TaxID=212423 RepID=A0A6N7KP47_9ACTN|nr:GNAT family N-acetyltransferase [Streptomyces kaniharaensis]MQS12339.1 GNAT family N-acetyltransferase [Streptomyces kaniharaensis]
MQIRSARPAEAELLSGIALRSKAYWGYADAFMAACRDELTLDAAAMEQAWAVVAEDGERVVGFATVTGGPPEAQLDMLFVEPDVIGRGVGRALFARARGRAEELGCRRLTIDSDPNAEPFYLLAMGAERIGFTPSGSIPGRELPLLALELPQGS